MSEQAIQTTNTKANAKVVAISGALLGIAATFAPSGLVFRPNRIFDGKPVSILETLGGWGWALIGLYVLVLVFSLLPQLSNQVRGLIVGLLGGIAPSVLLWFAGSAANEYALATGPVARVSFGYGFWLSILAAYIVVYAATGWTNARWSRTLISITPLVLGAIVLASGHLAALSVMREYANNESEFVAQLRLHLFYTIGATAGGMAIGIPLGLIAANKPKTEGVVFGFLNVLNVLPVLAFIGLLNPVLTWLSDSIPALAAFNIRAVGWAPVFIVLTAYAAYPIARNTHTAMLTLDSSLRDAARGIGMSAWQRLIEVELPLSVPVIIAGIRIALVQTTAGAIIAGLVGGGGLGSFVFMGASQTAIDLVLLGTIPIVILGLLFDRLALGTQRLLSRWSVAT